MTGGSRLLTRTTSPNKQPAMQRKPIRIGPPQDLFEREADRIADAVVSRGAGRSFEAAPITRSAAMVRRKCSCGSGSTTPCEACEEEQLQRKAAGGSAPRVAPPLVHTVLDTPGRLIEGRTRHLMEARLGSDFGNVRIHADAQAAESARQVHGLAYTVGPHIVFGAGRYAPGTPAGDRLIAHELVHTLQQQSAGPRVQRVCFEGEGCDEPSHPAPVSADTAKEAFLGPGWRAINELGIVHREGALSQGGGANLRPTPGGEPPIEWMRHNSKVVVLKHHEAQKVYFVARVDGSHAIGYASSDYIKINLPDPDARIWKVKPGESSLSIVRDHYPGHFNDAWYADNRYAVNALYWANAHQKNKQPTDQPAIAKRDTWVTKDLGFTKVRVLIKADSEDAPWDTVQVFPGRYLWLPGVEYLRSLYDVVREKGGGTGSIKAEVWQTVKGLYRKAAYAIAFVAGIVHGFLKSIFDAIAGIAELLYSFLKSLFSGELISDIKNLAGSLKKLFSEEGRAAVGEAISNWAADWDAKLKDSSPWVSGHAHGYLTGYVMAEAAMLLLTFGGAAALKGALWTSRVGKLVKGSRAVQTIEKVVEEAAKVARAADKRFDAAVEALKANRYGKAAVKAAEVTAKTVVWTAKGVMDALSLPGRMLVHLTDDVIARVKRLEPSFSRIKRLSDRAKWWLFGCHSPCKVNEKAIRKALKNLTDDEIEAAVKLIDPATLGPKKGARSKLAATPGEVHLDLPDVVEVAMARLKAKGVKGLPPSEYGTKLHAEVSAVLDETLGKVPKGWMVGSETRMSSLIKLDRATAKMTVRAYMKKFGMTDRYPALPKDFLDTQIGRLTPDVFARAPDGRTLVWDLTSRPDPAHLAKGMFYTELIGREAGGFLRIAEDYWRKIF